MRPQGEVGVDAVGLAGHPQLLEARGLGLREGLRELGQRRATPEIQGFAPSLRGEPWIAGGQRGAALAAQADTAARG